VERRERETYYSSTYEQNGDRNMLEVLSTPFTTPSSQMFEENIGRAIEEKKK